MSKNIIELLAVLKEYGIHDPKVLSAFQQIPREQFTREDDQSSAYSNTARPIECEQTISQPSIIALMTQTLLEIKPMKKVLEIGTGSGYQAALLSLCVDTVYSIERIEALYKQANNRFKLLQLKNIHTLIGDGYLGWLENAPFDGILVTAAAYEIPIALLHQLSPHGGRMIIPVGGSNSQHLKVIDRHGDTYQEQTIETVIFVRLKPGIE